MNPVASLLKESGFFPPTSVRQHNSEAPTQNGVDLEQSPPYPLSFNQIVELVTAGQPIPGIKDIPNTVLEGRASEATRGTRKKPWELDRDSDDMRS